MHDRSAAGFSLLEISISLVIIAVLSYTLMNGVGITRDYGKASDNRVYMHKIKTGLITFAQVNGYVPCPDTDIPQDGVENREAGGECTNARGRLPYMSIGVNSEDVWNQPVRYVVNARTDASGTLEIADATQTASATYFNSATAPFFTLNTSPFGVTGGAGNLTVCGEALALGATCSGAAGNANLIELEAIAVAVSFGKNGADTWAGNATSAPELENADNDDNFWLTNGSTIAGQEFDDQLVWITGYDIKYALLRSERGLQ